MEFQYFVIGNKRILASWLNIGKHTFLSTCIYKSIENAASGTGRLFVKDFVTDERTDVLPHFHNDIMPFKFVGRR